jgi:CubicO group peptidase (beta-lactamase class C family)
MSNSSNATRGLSFLFIVLLSALPALLVLLGGCARDTSDIASVTAEYDAAAAEDSALVEFTSATLSADEAEQFAQLSSALDALRENLRIPGMSAAVIKDQRLVWTRGFGLADIESGRAARPNTPYTLASLTKPFGSALLLRLVERGDVSLDDPATDYGIDYASPGTIRLRHLLSHTSQYFPGSTYRYHGDRFGSLDRVFWSKAGCSFTELVEREVIGPLGLTDTGFNPIDAVILERFLDFREARGEPRAILDPTGEPYTIGELDIEDPDIATTGGTLLTLLASVVDDALFNLDLLPRLPVDGSTVESFRAFWEEWRPTEDVWERMARPYVTPRDSETTRGSYAATTSCAAGILSSVVDLARFDAAIDWNLLVGERLQEMAMTPTVSTDGDTLPYGLGWFVHRYGDRKIVWHYGFWDCASSLIVKVPGENLTFVLLANTDTLSRPFGIGTDSDILISPAAELFLRYLVFDKGSPADLDWTTSMESIVETLAAVDDQTERDLLSYEVGAAARAALFGLLPSHTPEELLSAVVRAWPRSGLPETDKPPIAIVEDVESGELREARFALDAPKRLRVFAVGEGGDEVLYDYAWIEDATNGERLWFMKPLEADPAGGAAKNRKVDATIVLPAGRYVLRYRADDSHAYGDWNDLPPPGGFWGAVVWDQGTAAMGEEETTWERAADPASMGWSAGGLDSLSQLLGRTGTAAFMVVTGGKVVYEFGDLSYPFKCHSARKSLMSGLYGPYVDEGVFSPDATLADLSIEENPPLTDTERTARLEDLWKARSGVYIRAMGETPEMADARPERGSHEPGTFFYYNNWDFNVLGSIFMRETGESIGEAFERRIADPIGMEDYEPSHVTYTYQRASTVHPRYAFRMSTRDLARFGQLYLQNGEWDGRTVIPGEWVEKSTATYSSDPRFDGMGYAYMWWTLTRDALGGGWPADCYFAEGYGIHMCMVVPDLDTVIVHRANTDGSLEDQVGEEEIISILRKLYEARV